MSLFFKRAQIFMKNLGSQANEITSLSNKIIDIYIRIQRREMWYRYIRFLMVASKSNLYNQIVESYNRKNYINIIKSFRIKKIYRRWKLKFFWHKMGKGIYRKSKILCFTSVNDLLKKKRRDRLQKISVEKRKQYNMLRKSHLRFINKVDELKKMLKERIQTKFFRKWKRKQLKTVYLNREIWISFVGRFVKISRINNITYICKHFKYKRIWGRIIDQVIAKHRQNNLYLYYYRFCSQKDRTRLSKMAIIENAKEEVSHSSKLIALWKSFMKRFHRISMYKNLMDAERQMKCRSQFITFVYKYLHNWRTECLKKEKTISDASKDERKTLLIKETFFNRWTRLFYTKKNSSNILKKSFSISLQLYTKSSLNMAAYIIQKVFRKYQWRKNLRYIRLHVVRCFSLWRIACLYDRIVEVKPPQLLESIDVLDIEIKLTELPIHRFNAYFGRILFSFDTMNEVINRYSIYKGRREVTNPVQSSVSYKSNIGMLYNNSEVNNITNNIDNKNTSVICDPDCCSYNDKNIILSRLSISKDSFEEFTNDKDISLHLSKKLSISADSICVELFGNVTMNYEDNTENAVMQTRTELCITETVHYDEDLQKSIHESSVMSVVFEEKDFVNTADITPFEDNVSFDMQSPVEFSSKNRLPAANSLPDNFVDTFIGRILQSLDLNPVYDCLSRIDINRDMKYIQRRVNKSNTGFESSESSASEDFSDPCKAIIDKCSDYIVNNMDIDCVYHSIIDGISNPMDTFKFRKCCNFVHTNHSQLYHEYGFDPVFESISRQAELHTNHIKHKEEIPEGTYIREEELSKAVHAFSSESNENQPGQGYENIPRGHTMNVLEEAHEVNNTMYTDVGDDKPNEETYGKLTNEDTERDKEKLDLEKVDDILLENNRNTIIESNTSFMNNNGTNIKGNVIFDDTNSENQEVNEREILTNSTEIDREPVQEDKQITHNNMEGFLDNLFRDNQYILSIVDFNIVAGKLPTSTDITAIDTMKVIPTVDIVDVIDFKLEELIFDDIELKDDIGKVLLPLNTITPQQCEDPFFGIMKPEEIYNDLDDLLPAINKGYIFYLDEYKLIEYYEMAEKITPEEVMEKAGVNISPEIIDINIPMSLNNYKKK